MFLELRRKDFQRLIVMFSFMVVLLYGPALEAACSDGELTAVFIVDDIYPFNPSLTVLDVQPLGDVSNPTESEMIEEIQRFVDDAPWVLLDQAGPFHLFFSWPDDWGACAIVDGRDGRVVFAATTVHLGYGSIIRPVESSHPWSFTPGDPASPPADTALLTNQYWLEGNGSPESITEAVLDYLRDTDVLKSFGNCAQYSVVSYIYTPVAMFGVDPQTASQIIIVTGHAGSPWGDGTTDVIPSAPIAMNLAVSPNPFNPRTTISFSLDAPTPARIGVYSLDGKLVKSLADNLWYSAGRHELNWDGRDGRGMRVSSGIYVLHLETPLGAESKALTLVK